MDKVVIFIIGCIAGAVGYAILGQRDEFAADRAYCQKWAAETGGDDVSVRICLARRLQRGQQ